MALLKFLKGNYSNLNNAAINEGQVLICGDTGEMFVDVAADKRVKIGDFTVVSNLAALEALDATAVPTSRLYYIEDGNILARSNGIAWIQVNKQPTAEEMKTLLGLGDLAYLSKVAEGDLATDLATKISNKVDKADGKSLVDDDEITKLAGVSEGANKVEASENGKIKIDGVDTVVYAHPDKHSISEVDGLQDALDGKSDDGHKHVKADITDFDHTHVAEDITDLDDTIKAYGYATKSYVGDIPNGEDGNPMADSVVAYINKKTDGIATEGNLEALGGRVSTAEGEIDTLQADVLAINNAETGVLANAKAYVDEEDVFETDMATINALGGIAAGADLNGLTTHEVLKKLLYPYVDAAVGNATASPNGGTYEKGVTKTITSVSITVTKKSEPITSVALYNGSTLIEEKTGDAVKNGGTITFSGLSVEVPTNGNQLTVKVTYPDANGNAKTVEKKTTALTFVYPYYMGTCAAGTSIDETLVESLTKKIEGKGNKSNSFTVSDGHMVFAYPKAHGVLKSILDPNNFETIGNYTCNEVSVTGLDGTAQAYYVYVSGATTVSGFAVNFKY